MPILVNHANLVTTPPTADSPPPTHLTHQMPCSGERLETVMSPLSFLCEKNRAERQLSVLEAPRGLKFQTRDHKHDLLCHQQQWTKLASKLYYNFL